jgi:hypothetical protein
MIDLFVGIGEFAGNIVGLVGMAVNGIMTLFKIIPTAISYLTGIVDFVPEPVQPFILVTITGSILFLILGRSSGKEN